MRLIDSKVGHICPDGNQAGTRRLTR